MINDAGFAQLRRRERKIRWLWSMVPAFLCSVIAVLSVWTLVRAEASRWTWILFGSLAVLNAAAALRGFILAWRGREK